MEAQKKLHADPFNVEVIVAECEAHTKHREKQQLYLQFLKQKAKASWLKDADENTTLFYESIKARRSQNNVHIIADMNGVLKDNPEEVAGAFLEYYNSLLGTSMTGRQLVQPEIVKSGPLISNSQYQSLMRPYTAEEKKFLCSQLMETKLLAQMVLVLISLEITGKSLDRKLQKPFWISLKMVNY